MRALKTEVEFPSILRLSHSTISACVCHLLFCSVSYSTVKRAILQCHPVHWAFPFAPPQHMFSRLFQHVPKFPGVKPSSAINVNAWICTCATDSNLESGFSEATVILTAFSNKFDNSAPELSFSKK